MEIAEAAGLVTRYTAAWNACDADEVVALAHPEFRMYRMKGDVIDRDGLGETVRRQTYGAAMKLFPLRLYGDGERFALAARIEYRHVDGDELLGASDDGGLAFEIRGGALVLLAPQATCADALAREGLTEADLAFEWTPDAAAGAQQ